jgi:nucleotide-binding universal stress UspA family protein
VENDEAVIVVGVDGSDSSVAALRWSAAEAVLRRAKVRVVIAWYMPLLPSRSLAPSRPELGDLSADLDVSARSVLDRTVSEVSNELQGVEVDCRVRNGAPAEVLVEAASGADLLVVGSRGLGGFKGLMLGSVSYQCVQLAPCPVVIVRDLPANASS